MTEPVSTSRQRDIPPSDGRTLPALIIKQANDQKWDDVTDVLIVGLGGAGVCASLEALKNGVDVLAVDAYGGGGATRMSGGVYYGAGTKFQSEAGISDNAEEMFNYLAKELDETIDLDLLRAFCNASERNLEWLVRHGAQFSGALTEEKTAYPGAGEYLYYSGNERLPEFRAVARPAPRGHRTKHPTHKAGMTGRFLFDRLFSSAKKNGLRTLLHARVRQLVLNRDGEVLGARVDALHGSGRLLHALFAQIYQPMNPFASWWRKLVKRLLILIEAYAARTLFIRSNTGVILCTGGFVQNNRWVAHYNPELSRATPQGSIGCDGSGIALGQSAGGAIDRMSLLNIARSISPPSAFVSAIVVGRDGKRLTNEEIYVSALGRIIAEQGGAAWLIMDKNQFQTGLKQLSRLRPGSGGFIYPALPIWFNILFGGTKCAGDIPTLAHKCKINPAALAETLDEYNSAVRGERLDERGKSSNYLKAINLAPFYAINTSTNRSIPLTLAFTLGGLRVDSDSGAVIGEHEASINGLYAAGRAAAGLPSAGYVSGLSIADCVFTGRRAGRAAAKSPFLR